VFYISVAKVDWDVAHIAMAIHVCFKCMFQLFRLFQTCVVSVSSGCCKSRSECCIYMHVASVCFNCSQLFQTYVLRVLSGCCIYFAMVTHIFFRCFRRMLQMFQWFRGCILQVFHLNIAKVDRVLHMLHWDPPAATAMASYMRVGSGGTGHGAATGARSGGGWR
jgi:hypothetical protein